MSIFYLFIYYSPMTIIIGNVVMFHNTVFKVSAEILGSVKGGLKPNQSAVLKKTASYVQNILRT